MNRSVVFPWKPFEDSSTFHIHLLRQFSAPPSTYSRQMPVRLLSCFSVTARPRKRRFGLRIRAREICFCSRLQKSNWFCDPTQPSIQWVSGVFRGVSGRSKKLTPHLYLVPSLRMNGAIPLFFTAGKGTIWNSGSMTRTFTQAVRGSNHCKTPYCMNPTGWKVRGSNPGGERDFSHPSRPVLRPTQPPI